VDRGLRGLAPQIWADIGYEAEPLPGTPWDSIRLRASNGDIDVPIHVHPAGGYVGARFEGHWYEADIQVRACECTVKLGFARRQSSCCVAVGVHHHACYLIVPFKSTQHSRTLGGIWGGGGGMRLSLRQSNFELFNDA
jgi:hypothetical protein